MSTAFWTENQVAEMPTSAEESWAQLEKRANEFPRLYDLMPVNLPGQVILDYGCGPGHDTVLFCENGAGHVFYWDISPLALEIVEARLDMHGLADRASPAYGGQVTAFDHIHCAGVLHHMEDPLSALKGWRDVLNPAGQARVMIYDGDRSKHTRSKVPITLWWREVEFIYLCRMAGFDAEQVGHYECSAPWRPDCYAACYRLTCSR